MRMTFKTAATMLALCLVFQVRADTLLLLCRVKV